MILSGLTGSLIALSWVYKKLKNLQEELKRMMKEAEGQY